MNLEGLAVVAPGPAARFAPVTDTAAVAPVVSSPRELTPLDRRMRRCLFLPADPTPTLSERSARKAFEVSIYISAARCLLTYIVLPFIFPIIGVSTRATPWVGIPVSLIAVAADYMSIRRFWRADHRFRWHYTALAGAIICAMLVLLAIDVTHIVTE
jgi:hypothetical protein